MWRQAAHGGSGESGLAAVLGSLDGGVLGMAGHGEEEGTSALGDTKRDLGH